jgi:hypothetical protein
VYAAATGAGLWVMRDRILDALWMVGLNPTDEFAYCPHITLAYVPEGADVIPQWDEVYGIRLPCWPGELFIPVKDVSSTPVTEIEEI